MLGLIERIWHDLTTGFSKIEHWIVGLIHAVYGYIDRIYHYMRSAVADVWHSLEAFSRSIAHYAEDVYKFAKWIVDVAIPHVVHWALHELDAVWHDIENLGKWAVRWIDRLIHDIAAAVSNIYHWVIRDIWTPLKNDFLTAWHWITHEGAYLYDLITHPEKLVALIGGYLWKSWLDLLVTYGKPLARWLLHSLTGMVGPLAHALESLIANLM